MADSFDTQTREGRVLQFIMMLGAKDMSREKIEEFLDTPRPELSNGIIKTARQLIEEDATNIRVLARVAEFERTQGIPDILGLKPS